MSQYYISNPTTSAILTPSDQSSLLSKRTKNEQDGELAEQLSPFQTDAVYNPALALCNPALYISGYIPSDITGSQQVIYNNLLW